MKHLCSYRSGHVILMASTCLMVYGATAQGASPEPSSERPMLTSGEVSERSGGSYQLRRSALGAALGPHGGNEDVNLSGGRTVNDVFESFNFDDNSTETGGFVFIPPDPIGAAGPNSLIAVGNVMIESRFKFEPGGFLWRDSLQDFFAPVSPVNFTFDPKVVYDHYAGRFVVVTLERVVAEVNPDPGNTSRILVAVSKNSTPINADPANWYHLSIDAKEVINGWDHWVDYPGFEVDEEAIYITGRMFAHEGGVSDRAVRLWIIDKGLVGGFYDGGPPAFTKYDPFTAVGLPAFRDHTTMPAQVYGAGGAGAGVGTYLVQYNGITAGGAGQPESVLVLRVDNPIGATTFTAAFVDVGDIEDLGGAFGFPPLPDAPQLGTSRVIDVNDRRALDAVWRNDALWFTATIMPNSGPFAGRPTAHWFKLDTSAWPPVLADQGDIGGEELDPGGGVFTFFPSLAVNDAGDAVFGFSASSPGMYCGAYVTGRQAGDPAGTVRPVETVRAGLDFYIRDFGTPRNRWGDYSGASLDPADENVFWVFNEYAIQRGTMIDGEDGRWGTAWGGYSFGPAFVPEAPGLPPDAVHQARKHRYITIDSTTNGAEEVGLSVRLTSLRRCSGDLERSCVEDNDCDSGATGPCVEHPDVGSTWWVQAPQDEPLGCLPGPCGPTDQFARVDAAFHSQVWDLSTLHIGDCEIPPVATFEVRACVPPDGSLCGDPLVIGTIEQPLISPTFRGNYGDVAGAVVGTEFTPPDGFGNVNDVSAYQLTVQNYGTANTPQAHPTWIDLNGLGPGQPPQYILNVSDLGQILGALQGAEWTTDPGNLNPGSCP